MPGQDAESRTTPKASRNFMRGLRLGLPVFLGYVPIGAAYGIVATTVGFSFGQAIASSAFPFAGAGQFIAANLIKGGAGAVAVILATGVINLRHLLFGASLAPYLHETPRALQVPLAFTMTDETFGVNVTDLQAGKADDYSMLGVGVVSWTGWTLGTALGAGAATLIGDPTRWGVDFAMAAMFTALLVAQITGRKHAAAGAAAMVLTFGLSFLLPGAWPMIVGAMGAATLATVIDR
jgi:4-azaleucine resistance transporter AzlC